MEIYSTTRKSAWKCLLTCTFVAALVLLFSTFTVFHNGDTKYIRATTPVKDFSDLRKKLDDIEKQNSYIQKQIKGINVLSHIVNATGQRFAVIGNLGRLLKQSLKQNENMTKILKRHQKNDGNQLVKLSNGNQVVKLSEGKTMDEIRKSNPHVALDEVRLDLKTTYKMLILVSSHSAHFERRERIRKAWGNSSMWTTKKLFKVIFVLGKTTDERRFEEIKEESKTFGDIMLEDVKEDYFKLSFKVMIGFKWAYESFNFEFVFKTDDDIFVQLDRVMERLDRDFADKGFIGHVMYGQPVIRPRVTKEEHPGDTYDPYCSGGGFIISKQTIGKILPMFEWNKPLAIDDAYIGEMVFKAGVKAYHVPEGFYMWNDWCQYNEHLLLSHPVKIIKCMDFMVAHSLIDNGKLVNDTIRERKYGNKPADAKG